MIVVDRHAFDSLWPALGAWLLLFIIAGDGWVLMRRQYALVQGRPAQARVIGKRQEYAPVKSRKDVICYLYTGADGVSRTGCEPVGRYGRRSPAVGENVAVHVLPAAAYLDDDLGYSRWKLWLFGGAFIALWVWAALRYRFG